MVSQRLYDELFALPRTDLTEVADRIDEFLLASTPTDSDNPDEDTRRLLNERMDAYEQDKAAGRPLGMSLEETTRFVNERLANIRPR